MITKNDCMTILIKLEDNGINIDLPMRQLAISKEIPVEVLKFIQQYRGFEVSNFYEMLRKKHNQNKSPLYTNIMKELDNENDILTTLSCLITQIILYNKKLTYTSNFLREVRITEIITALNAYFSTGDITNAMMLLRVIKSDVLVLEYISGRRDLQ